MTQCSTMRDQFLTDLKKRKGELWQQLSKYDSQEQDLLHFLEAEKYDAVTMVRVTKLLKDSRIARRKIKVELEQIQSLSDVVSHRNMKRFEEKPYTYRTDILSMTAQRTQGMKACNKNLFTQQND